MEYGIPQADQPLNDTLSHRQLSLIYKAICDSSNELIRDNVELVKKRMSRIKSSLDLIDSDKQVLYWNDFVLDKRNIFGEWFKFHTTKKFSYLGLPFENYEEIKNNGEFKDCELNKSDGTYKSTYQSEKGKDGDAKVEIYLKSRDIPGNKLLIENLKAELKKEEGNLANFEDDIAEKRGKLILLMQLLLTIVMRNV